MHHLTTQVELSKANYKKEKAFNKIYPHETCCKKISSKIYRSHMKVLIGVIRTECNLNGCFSHSYDVLASKSGLSLSQVKRTLSHGRKNKIIITYYHSEIKVRRGKFVDILLPEYVQAYHDHLISQRWFPKANKLAKENPDLIDSNLSKKKTLKEELKESLPRSTSVSCNKSIYSLDKEFVRKEEKKATRIPQNQVKKERDPKTEFAKAFPESKEMQEKCWYVLNECVLKHKLAKFNAIGYTITLVKKQEADSAIEFYEKKNNSQKKTIKEKQEIRHTNAINHLKPIENIIELIPYFEILRQDEDRITYKYHNLQDGIYFERTAMLNQPDSVMNCVKDLFNSGPPEIRQHKNKLKSLGKHDYIH